MDSQRLSRETLPKCLLYTIAVTRHKFENVSACLLDSLQCLLCLLEMSPQHQPADRETWETSPYKGCPLSPACLPSPSGKLARCLAAATRCLAAAISRFFPSHAHRGFASGCHHVSDQRSIYPSNANRALLLQRYNNSLHKFHCCMSRSCRAYWLHGNV